MSQEYNPDSVDAVLARIETKLDVISRRLETGDNQFGTLNSRVASLERWKWTVLGGAAVVAALVKFVLDYLRK